MNKKIFLICFVLIIVSMSGCTDRNGESQSSNKVVIFARSGDSVGLDPATVTDGESHSAIIQILGTLVQFEQGKTNIEPALAESWDVSSDGLAVTFNLRKGVKFHDGTPFNADAVIFSLMRQMDENHPYYGVGGVNEYWTGMDMSNIIDTIEAEDDYTVVFKLKKVEAPFVANLAMNFASIVSPTAFKKDPEAFSSNPVGTGPFRFVSWTKDSDIVLEKNPDFWGDTVAIDRLILRVIPDATARWLALKKGEVDLIDFPASDDIPAMKADPDINVLQQPGLNVGYLALNVEKAPYTDRSVRQAMNYAIDRQEIIDAVFGTAGQVAKNPIPPTMWSYNDDIKAYPYDPGKARELLKEAGYANGFETEIWAMPVARPYNPDARKIAEIMQAQLAKVDVKVKIVSYDWGEYLERTANGEHQACMLGWTGDNGDPDNFLFYLLSIASTKKPAGNKALWKNKEFDSLITEAKETTDVARRTELYRKAQVIFHDEAPWVPLAHSVVTVPTSKRIKNFIISPLGRREFKNVRVEG